MASPSKPRWYVATRDEGILTTGGTKHECLMWLQKSRKQWCCKVTRIREGMYKVAGTQGESFWVGAEPEISREGWKTEGTCPTK
jgi:hypothetical protein